MSRIRSSGNYTTEIRFIQMMRRYKISGWRRRSVLPGRPDFVFAKYKVAVFIDGDFWHGNPKNFRIPKTNCDYWQAKIAGNRERDRRITREIRKNGWRVIRFWESALADEEAVIAKLRLLL
jgi:DNA mismatch endonuclease (patch repair protein)